MNGHQRNRANNTGTNHRQEGSNFGRRFPNRQQNGNSFENCRRNNPDGTNNRQEGNFGRRHQDRQQHNNSNTNWRQNNQENSSNSDRRFQNRRNDLQRNDREDNNRSSNDHGRQYNRGCGPRAMGFKAMEELIETDIDNIILAVNNDKQGFAETLKRPMSGDMIVLVVKVLRKISESSFNDAKLYAIRTTLDSPFMEHLQTFISTTHTHGPREKNKNSYFWMEPEAVVNNILVICESYLSKMPTQACEIFQDLMNKIKVQITVLTTLKQASFSEETIKKVDDLIRIIDLRRAKLERTTENPRSREDRYDDAEPPEDFREIPVYPTVLELTTGETPFLRKNIVQGRYRDAEQYLDIQYRLLREDFIGPLRKGILDYLNPRHKQRPENIRIYKNVCFLTSEIVTEDVCLRLQFENVDPKKKKQNKTNYENSRRFMFGSLLCFTCDHFQSLIFGTVAKRDVADLEKGQLVVGFKTKPLLEDCPYIMVECNIYFEPYYHVLNVLKQMEIDTFPMERYILRVDTQSNLPKYLSNFNTSLTIEGRVVSPHYFPDYSFYGLNEAQRVAFRAALTQEFAIIQGPPGTGKTFLGLKIAQTLLANYDLWYVHSPILVICYTNHALDQFLEGILQFTKKIIRVGGQSKNDTLKEYNLNKFRRQPNSDSRILGLRRELRGVVEDMKSITERIKMIEENLCIMPINEMVVVNNITDTWFNKEKRTTITDWLLEGVYDDDVYVPQYTQQNVVQGGTVGGGGEDEEDDEDDIEVEIEENDEDQDEIFDVRLTKSIIPLINLNDRRRILEEIANKERVAGEAGQLFELQNAREEYQKWDRTFQYVQRKLEQKSDLENMEPQHVNLQAPENMNYHDRWILYFNWLKRYENNLKDKLATLDRKFRNQYLVYEDSRKLLDVQFMRNAHVIGMTTTGAARLQSSLQALKNPIVIVEEAAEVLEAHIISALTPNCQHLILIGDHQQLKPSTSDYKIETFYKLGISLFERMVLNKVNYYTLNIQHRMRPEIASLVTPAIYPDLIDHESVKNRSDIRGIDNNLFFIHHTNKEAECSDFSKKNKHEAEFLIELARHLVLNGYEPKEITILAAYLGQMFELMKLKRRYQFLMKDVRICVLDNYQGEECRIILLSLVRNNDDNKIGFLKIENRVCVALSRARDGMYIMGNMDLLCENSEIWPKIREQLQKQNAIGAELSLRCQIHTDTVTLVKSGDDFVRIPEGGCHKICGALLDCGHTCKQFCHVEDREHRTFPCTEICLRPLCEDDTHQCKKLCSDPCGPCTYPKKCLLKCGHSVQIECHKDPDLHECTVPVMTTLSCNHQTKKPCFKDAANYPCPFPCEFRIETCGHSCKRTCHINDDPDHLKYKCKKKCAKPRVGCSQQEPDQHICPRQCCEECMMCTISVKKQRNCGHFFDVPCCTNVNLEECSKPCKLLLPCGHKCKRKCCEPCGGCKEIVQKKVSGCDHVIKIACEKEADRSYCKQHCPRLLSCGHKCTKRCCDTCTENCMEMVTCKLKSSCGHEVTKIPCHLFREIGNIKTEVLLQYCTNPCLEKLKCDHLCLGTCGTCFQSRFHMNCNQKCDATLLCNHPCPIPCREQCKPCQRKCAYRCIHSKCSKKCGEPCVSCKEKCPRRCEHQFCDRKCSDICSVQPCEEPCEKMLKCGHPCVGFCGDPCPPLCRICNVKELTEIFFGMEDEDDARFVLLHECGHVIESEGMKNWLETKSEGKEDMQINMKCCPKCKTTLSVTRRYSDQIKQIMIDVQAVKKKINGSKKEIDQKRELLKGKLSKLINKVTSSQPQIKNKILPVLTTYENFLKPELHGRRQYVNNLDLQAIDAKLQLIENICETTKEDFKDNFIKSSTHFHFIVDRLEAMNALQITNQQIDDAQLEIAKLQRYIQYEKITSSPNYHYYASQANSSLLSIRILSLSSRNNSNSTIKSLSEDILNKLEKPSKYSLVLDKELAEKLKELQKAVPGSVPITDRERKEILRAMGLSQGHWYKCPNGHIYAIGDCGGAMQVSRCNECKAEIGGTSHRLLSSNQHAPEMDGSSHPAWSEQNNLLNYRGFL